MLELLDVSGRRLEARPLAGLGPGPHVLNLGEGASLAAGIYLIRLAQGGNTLTRKACVVK